MREVFIRTPATTANLGPGFDCVGLALEIYNELRASWTEAPLKKLTYHELISSLESKTEFTIKGEGEKELTRDKMGLFFNALASILSLDDNNCLLPQNLTLSFLNNIPLARGLGSSAACIISALCLAREILASQGRTTREDLLLEQAIKFDGYPDNVLPAYFGGASINIVNKEGLARTFPFKIPKELDFILIVPELKISSAAAREVLPRTVSLKDAVKNSALLGALMLAFNSHDFANLKELVQSPLHVPYRSQLIPNYSVFERIAYENGALAFTISGAGSSLLVLANENSKRIGEIMIESARVMGIEARYIISKLENKGVCIN